MPIQVYNCPEHGEFDMFTHFKDEVEAKVACPKPMLQGISKCYLSSKHVLKPIAAAIVPGGTGGGKDMHLKR